MAKNYIGFVLLFFLIFQSIAQDVATISVNIIHSDIDSLKCTLSVNPITNNREELFITRKTQLFTKTIPVDNYLFITLNDGRNSVEGIIEPGDNITVSYDANHFDSTLVFFGKGSRKLTICRDYKRAMKVILAKKLISYAEADTNTFEKFYAEIDSVENVLLKNLNEGTFSISSSNFNILKGEIKGVSLFYKYLGLEKLLGLNLLQDDSIKSLKLSNKTLSDIKGITNFNSSYYISPQYVRAVYYVLATEYQSRVNADKIEKNNIEEKYAFINSKLKDQLIIPVRTLFLLSDMEENSDQLGIYSIITKTFQNHSTSEFKPFLEKEYNSYRLGKKAPDFTLEDFEGKKVSLEDLKGKVVYMNFWFSGNTACHNLFGKLRIVKDHFKDNPNVVFLTISVDSKELWTRSLAGYKIQGYHCYTQGKGMEHPMVTAYTVNKFPTNYLIDKTGNFLSTAVPDQPLELITVIENALNEPLVVESSATNSKVSKRR